MQKSHIRLLSVSVLCATALFAASGLLAADAPKSVLKKGDRVAVLGDSITEQKQYSKFIEIYLTACLPDLELHIIQLGWSGETAPGLQGRMEYDLMPFNPTVATTCYGMNDGGYKPFNEATGNAYRNAMTAIVNRLKTAGATIVVGAPGAVDTKAYRKGGDAPKMYNITLGELRDIAHKLADSSGMPFANVHDTMMDTMELAKAALGENYDVCGGDGVHPNANGQLVMAYAFLKGMGLDGDIGTITVDMKGQATATDGHKVISAASGKVELESTRYPFCFFGDEKSSGSTRSILPFLPFNRDLNRLKLVVNNLDGEKAKVTWGAASKVFAKADLEKGINLAEQFLDNPFCEQFHVLEGAVATKENFETPMTKECFHSLPNVVKLLDKPDAEATMDLVRKKLFEKYEKLHETVRAAHIPVKHTLTITVEK